jgi:LacI family transcriptional regulator
MENKKATIRDVAALANVSIATISRYLNGNIPVADETGKRIARAIETLSYTPDRIAKSLKTGRMNNIMHVVPDITNPYYARMYRAVQGYAMQKGYTVMLYDTAALEINEEKAVQLFSNRDADGLFFCTIDKSRAVFDKLKALNSPVVTNTRFDELLFDTIYSPGGHGIYIAAKHLLDLKHRDIAYAGGSAHSIVNMRRRSGFQKAMDEAGIQVHPDYFFEMDFTMDGGYRAGVYFAGLNQRPTAICCANDMIAMGVMQALNERGIRIPDDISLTGEDNIEYVQICRPGLTTTHNPSDFVAEQAVKMLIERIEDQYTGAPREVICARELIIRNSTKALSQKQ